jgi:23S rRNA pseudouridine1911/1915/1917 synthase
MSGSADPLGERRRFVVEVEDDGRRLDAFLTQNIPGTSRSRVRQAIDCGEAVVEGKSRKASFRLQAGQAVEFLLPPPAAPGPEPEPIPLVILFEDEHLAVVVKPAGMVVHPAKGHWAGTLASALVHHFVSLSQSGGPTRPGIVHRLDRDTSGVLVVAKTDAAHAALAEQFKSRTVEKEYLAIVAGAPDRDRDLVDHPIGDHPTHREKKALRSGHASSREAQTFYEVVERYPGIALLRAHPKTGRTHQIRLHLAGAKLPVLCDKLYGGTSQLTLGQLRARCRDKRLGSPADDEQVLLDRHALHAHRLSVRHPASGEALEFRAELPDDMERLLTLLRGFPRAD